MFGVPVTRRSVSINEVNLRRARLVLGWVTVRVRLPGARHFIMAAMPSRCGHSILPLWLLSFFLSSFSSSSILSGGRLDVYHTCTSTHDYGLSANLECMCEMCCTWLAENTGCKNYAKIAICTPSHNLSGCIFAIKACIDNRRNVKQQYLLHTSSQYGACLPTNGWDRLVSFGHPANFNGFRVLASLLHQRRSTEVNHALHDVCPSPGLVHYA